jgi:hypothetical protein
MDTFIHTGPLEWISFDNEGDRYAVDGWSDSLVQYDGKATVRRQSTITPPASEATRACAHF